MPIRCLDCGSQQLRVSPEGRCVACDSFNVERMNDQSLDKSKKEKEPKTLIEIFIMVLVWGLLLYGIWDRYLR